jgi:hypothetical protein
MKVPGCRIFSTCLVMMAFLAWPVQADETYITKTTIDLQMDGRPYSLPSKIIMNCFGPYQSGDHGMPNTFSDNTDPNSAELVFSFHATCPGYHCRIFEPYSHVDRLKIDYCDIEVETGTTTYNVRNYSAVPNPSCIWYTGWETTDGNGSYLTATPQLKECRTAALKHRNSCLQIRTPGSSEEKLNEPGLGIWQEKNGSYWKRPPEYFACLDEARSEERLCEKIWPLLTVNSSDLILDPDGIAVQRVCTLNISLMSAFGGADSRGISSHLSPVSRRPVESFYCVLQQFFGGMCE